MNNFKFGKWGKRMETRTKIVLGKLERKIVIRKTGEKECAGKIGVKNFQSVNGDKHRFT